MTYYLFLAAAIVLEVIATTLLKASNGFTVLIPAVSSLLFYAVSFYCLSICLTLCADRGCICDLVGVRDNFNYNFIVFDI